MLKKYTLENLDFIALNEAFEWWNLQGKLGLEQFAQNQWPLARVKAA